MKIVFIGTVDFSRQCLKTLLEMGDDVAAVFTLDPEKKERHSDFADLGPLARSKNIPLHRVHNINDVKNISLLGQYKPDYLFVFGWSQILAKHILSIPVRGCVGTHPALLPKNRGRHPLIWTLVEGLTESGLTFFFLGEGADDGDILWQKKFAITLADDATTLYRKITNLAKEGIQEFLPLLRAGEELRKPQDHSQATYWCKRSKEDGKLDWNQPTLTLYNLVRALTRPYPGASALIEGNPARIWKAALPKENLPEEAVKNSSGTILRKNGNIIDIKTGDSYLTVLEYEISKDSL